MTPESLLYLPLTIHVGDKSEPTYAPMLPNPVWADEGLAAYVLTQSSRELKQGLYLLDGERWQFTMPQPVLSDILIRGNAVNVYLGLPDPLTVGVNAIVYKNGILYAPRELQGGAVFCVLSPLEQGETPIYLPATQNISGHRVIVATPSGAAYASSDDPSTANAVVGLSTGAALAGDYVTVQTDGELTEPSWSWTPGEPVFCGLNGLLTQTNPTVGYSLIVGIAIQPTTILISVKQPIVLN